MQLSPSEQPTRRVNGFGARKLVILEQLENRFFRRSRHSHRGVDRWQSSGGEVAWQKPDTHPDFGDVVDPPGIVQSSARLDLRNVVGKAVSDLAHGSARSIARGRAILKHQHGAIVQFCERRCIPSKPREEFKPIAAKFSYGCCW